MALQSAQPQPELRGQAAVITGATSGIGRAIALELARAGADIFVHGRSSPERLASLRAAVEALGARVEGLLADLADERGQDTLVQGAFAWRPDLSIWINNAGVDVLTGANRELPYEQKLAALWRVDVAATIRLTRAVGQRLAAAAGGVILNMGWDQAEHGMGGDSGELFAASKGAVIAFTRSAALSLSPKVRVNCLAPGWIKTAWGEQASDYWQQRAIKESQLARWGTPEDVARVARWLVSPGAAYVHGQVVAINGGPKAI
ncbi:MAG: SDR family oxidoreductase [Pirellulales bacterium]|nr:SDR family oxidoreductase [Pirellulales bacterium]